MIDATPTAERREEILGELAEWMHAAAREAQRRLLEAETTDDFVKLTGSLAKLARGVRQSILIHRKLETERLEAARRADDAAAGAQAGSEFVPRHVKRVRIRTAITRHVWNELEDDEEAELFRDDLNARLDELEGADDFLDAPLDDLIAQLCRDLGFDPPEPSPPPAGVDRDARTASAPVAKGPGPGPGPAPAAPALHAPNTS
jgi:hypothetical protein